MTQPGVPCEIGVDDVNSDLFSDWGTFFIGPLILSDRKLYLYFYPYDIQCRIFLYISYARYYKLN